MDEREIDEVLAGSGPRFATTIATEAALDALVLDARAGSAGSGRRARQHRGLLWLLPAAALGVGALTGGALVVDQLTRIDVPIEIGYTTDTGVAVACTAHIESSYFAPEHGAVTEYYATHDFTSTGVGQRIYEYALVLAGDKVGTEADLPDTVAWLPEEGWEPEDARSAVNSSILSFAVQDVIDELGLYSGSGASMIQTDCTGRLH